MQWVSLAVLPFSGFLSFFLLFFSFSLPHRTSTLKIFIILLRDILDTIKLPAWLLQVLVVGAECILQPPTSALSARLIKMWRNEQGHAELQQSLASQHPCSQLKFKQMKLYAGQT